MTAKGLIYLSLTVLSAIVIADHVDNTTHNFSTTHVTPGNPEIAHVDVSESGGSNLTVAAVNSSSQGENSSALTTVSIHCPIALPCICSEKMEDYYRYYFLPDLTGLHVRCVSKNLTLETLPDIEASNLSIASLHISRNKDLEDLPLDYFNTIPELSLLDLQANALKSVPSSLSNLSRLHTLFLDRNQIDLRNEEYIFSSLASLRYLDLSHNNITILKSGVFTGLENLESLKLRNNSISELVPGAFNGLRHILTLSLAFNNIRWLKSEMFKGMASLLHLDLADNKITHLNGELFINMPKLESVYLYRNGINVINSRAFKGLLQLSALNLDSNLLNDLPQNVFEDNIRLGYLNLKNNSLDYTIVKSDIFAKFASRLQALLLGKNKITQFPRGFFDKFPSLELLYLVDLPLRAMPNITQLFRLKYLFLSGTNISEIYVCELPHQNDLRVIDWGPTHLTCDCNLRWLYEWYKEHPIKLYASDRLSIGSPVAMSVYLWTFVHSIQEPKCTSKITIKGKSQSEALTKVNPDGLICQHGRDKSDWCNTVFHPRKPTVIFQVQTTTKSSISLHWNVTQSESLRVFYIIISYKLNSTKDIPNRQLLQKDRDMYEIPDLLPARVYQVCIELIGKDNVVIAQSCQIVKTSTRFTSHNITLACLVPLGLIAIAGSVLVFIYRRMQASKLRERQVEFENPGFCDDKGSASQEYNNGNADLEMSTMPEMSTS